MALSRTNSRTRRSTAGSSPLRRARMLEVLAGAASRATVVGLLARPSTRWQRAAPHLLQLHPRRHLLREERRLDAMEQALQPANELRLGDPQLGVGRNGVLGERQGEPLQLVAQLGRQP